MRLHEGVGEPLTHLPAALVGPAGGEPELFDGSQDMPLCAVGYEYSPFVKAACDTCGDDPETLTIEYLTHGGEVRSKIYWDFGLPCLLETAEKWNVR